MGTSLTLCIGHINLHKNHETPREAPANTSLKHASQSVYSSSEYRAREGWGSAARPDRGRFRAHKSAYGPYRNRTLVFKNVVDHKTASTSKAVDVGDSAAKTGDNVRATQTPEASSTSSWITKHDRHTQLINKSVLARETQQRTTAIEESRRQRVWRKDRRDHVKFDHHLDIMPGSNASSVKGDPIAHSLQFNGISFKVCNGGRKLLRDHCKYVRCVGSHANATAAVMASAHTTPKRAVIGGVTFVRSKHGNLYRSGIVRATRYANPGRTIAGLDDHETAGAQSSVIGLLAFRGERVSQKTFELCKRFTSTGTRFLSSPCSTREASAVPWPWARGARQ